MAHSGTDNTCCQQKQGNKTPTLECKSKKTINDERQTRATQKTQKQEDLQQIIPRPRDTTAVIILKHPAQSFSVGLEQLIGRRLVLGQIEMKLVVVIPAKNIIPIQNNAPQTIEHERRRKHDNGTVLAIRHHADESCRGNSLQIGPENNKVYP